MTGASDVEILREAAARMRAHAQPLVDLAERNEASAHHVDLQQRRHGGGSLFRDHFAPWSPQAALALADWLVQWADHMETCEVGGYTCSVGAGSYSDGTWNDAALDVARAFLGTTS